MDDVGEISPQGPRSHSSVPVALPPPPKVDPADVPNAIRVQGGLKKSVEHAIEMALDGSNVESHGLLSIFKEAGGQEKTTRQQDRKDARAKLAGNERETNRWLRVVVAGYLMLVVGFQLLATDAMFTGVGLKQLTLSDWQVGAFLAKTTAEVFGAFLVVTKYLFPNKRTRVIRRRVPQKSSSRQTAARATAPDAAPAKPPNS